MKAFSKDLYPFSPNHLDVGGATMHYVDEGPRDAPALLMLHGNPTWSFYYRNLVLGLRDDYRCIVPDHVGCGLSDKPQDYAYTLEQRINDVERLVETLELRAITLVVHDWGGAIGMGLAVRRPDLVRRFVVLNTSAFLSPNIPRRINILRLPIFGAVMIRAFNAFAGPAVSMATGRPGGLPRDIRDGYLAPYDSWDHRIAVWNFVQDIPMGPRDRSYALMKSIDEGSGQFADRPVLVCWGGRDFCFDDTFLALWKERFPDADVHCFADAGHYVLEDAGDDILRLVKEFLANQ